MRLNQDQLGSEGESPPGPAAFGAFYRRHIQTVMRLVVRRVTDPHLAADLTADIFVAALDSAHTYDPSRGSEIAWLHGIARHVLLAERRRAARDTQTLGEIAGRRLLDSDDLARMEERIDAERQTREALAAMRSLPESERAVLELVVIDQLTVTEAAAALGLRSVAARVRLHRARRKLQHVVSLDSPLHPVEGQA
ncbi:sigma-70 family RNA polymerase sigma factor [Nonomuraea sp. NPDC026600]|uniref:RNA polymerase sigma factor n=1 Tax=Nonomuraea sp. NPDC026600 TaxID=3155363 RepID=UPI0033CAA792